MPGCVVQLDRISDFGSEGWGFESLRGHEMRINKNLNKNKPSQAVRVFLCTKITLLN